MSISVTPEQLAVLRDTLLNTQGSTPLHERFRALFMLKAVGGDEVVQIISEGEVLHRTSVDRMRC
jgi:deoxyhypusine monooxygenase